jgi:hypothetical protein
MRNKDSQSIPRPPSAVKQKEAAGAATHFVADPTTTTKSATSLRVFVFEFSKVSESLKVSETQSLQGDERSFIHSLAVELADRVNGNSLQRYQLGFTLAQKLRGQPGAPGQMPSVEELSILRVISDEFWHVAGPRIRDPQPAAEFFEEFRAKWRRVQIAAGTDPQRIITRDVLGTADQEPIQALTGGDWLLTKIARIADELSKQFSIFQLRQSELAVDLLTDPTPAGQRRISRAIGELVDLQITHLVHRSTGKGDANKYVAGPALLALRDQPAQLKLVINKPSQSTAIRGGEQKYGQYDKLTR